MVSSVHKSLMQKILSLISVQTYQFQSGIPILFANEWFAFCGTSIFLLFKSSSSSDVTDCFLAGVPHCFIKASCHQLVLFFLGRPDLSLLLSAPVKSFFYSTYQIVVFAIPNIYPMAYRFFLLLFSFKMACFEPISISPVFMLFCPF